MAKQLQAVPHRGETEQHEWIRCPECGHEDPAPEGAALIYALRAPCPRCGGRECELAPVVAVPIRRVA